MLAKFKMNDVKTNRPEPPDKSLFMAMMGVFFLCFAIAPAYWAYYNFGEYRRTDAFVKELRQSSEQSLTPNERQERENRIASNASMADRYLLAMSLSAAGSFVLFGIAFLLFRKALKSRQLKNEYEIIDWRTVPQPRNRVEVRYKSAYNILFVLIAIFFIAMALLISFQTLNSQFESSNSKLIKGILFPAGLFLMLFVIAFLQFRAKRQAARLFDASGITRNDGRHFAWNEFRGVVTQTDFNQRTQRKYVWRIELAFADGETAWLIPNRIKNYDEVFTYAAALPSANLKN